MPLPYISIIPTKASLFTLIPTLQPLKKSARKIFPLFTGHTAALILNIFIRLPKLLRTVIRSISRETPPVSLFMPTKAISLPEQLFKIFPLALNRKIFQLELNRKQKLSPLPLPVKELFPFISFTMDR